MQIYLKKKTKVVYNRNEHLKPYQSRQWESKKTRDGSISQF